MKVNIYIELIKVFDGGPNSGNYGHAGRPGKVGGSTSEFMTHLDKEIKNNPQNHSISKYLKDDKLTPGRTKMHANIIKNYIKNANVTDNPVIYFNGGGSASGKSTVIKKLFPEVPLNENKNGIIVDPDDIKKKIPEYNEMIKNGNPKAAGYVHEESSALAKMLFNKAVRTKSYNTLMDGTLGGKLEKAKAKIENAKKSGLPVVGNFVTVDIDEALKRNYLRYLKEARLPGIDDVIKIHKEVSRNYPELAPLFTNSTLIDNNGDEPVIIAKSDENGKLKILDKEKYKKFVNKTKEDENEIKERFRKMIPIYEKQFLAANPGKKLRPRPEF